MKLKVLLFGLVVFCMAACTQKTCPTYTQNDAPQQEVVQGKEATQKV